MTIKFWEVGAGDAITIRFNDTSGHARNLFVDGGYVGTYAGGIKHELHKIEETGEVIDLWILTHTDRDHIGGVEAFIKDSSFADKTALVGTFWFNWSDYFFFPAKKKLSIGQGIRLRNYLDSIGKLMKEDITTSTPPVDFFGLKVTILSPDAESLEKSKVRWNRIEKRVPISARVSDYGQTIDELSTLPATEDTDAFNGGSLALLVENGSGRLMLLGDSHPSVVASALTSLGYTKSDKLRVDFIKLSHHGSKRNISRELLELVDCVNYIILADGISNALPNKWTLANILTSAGRDYTRKINFYFNSSNPRVKTIFSSDGDTTKYNFSCVYADSPFLKISLP